MPLGNPTPEQSIHPDESNPTTTQEGTVTSISGEVSRVERYRETFRSIYAAMEGLAKRFADKLTPQQEALVQETAVGLTGAVEAAEELYVLMKLGGDGDKGPTSESTVTIGKPITLSRREFLKATLAATGALLAGGISVTSERSTPHPVGATENPLLIPTADQTSATAQETSVSTIAPSLQNNTTTDSTTLEAVEVSTEHLVDEDLIVKSAETGEVLKMEDVLTVGKVRFYAGAEAPIGFNWLKSFTGHTTRLETTLESLPVWGGLVKDPKTGRDRIPADERFSAPEDPNNYRVGMAMPTDRALDTANEPGNRPVFVVAHAGIEGDTVLPFDFLSQRTEANRGGESRNVVRGKYVILSQVAPEGGVNLLVLRTNNVTWADKNSFAATYDSGKGMVYYKTGNIWPKDDPDERADLILMTCDGAGIGWAYKSITSLEIVQEITPEMAEKYNRFTLQGPDEHYKEAASFLLNASANEGYGGALDGNRSNMRYLKQCFPSTAVPEALMVSLVRIETDVFPSAAYAEASVRRKISTTPLYSGSGVNDILNKGRGGSGATTLLEVNAVGELGCRGLAKGTNTEMTEELFVEEYLQMKQYDAILGNLQGYLGEVAGYDRPEKLNQQFLRGGLRFMCEVIQRGVLKEEFGIENNYYEMQVLGKKHDVTDIDGAVGEMLALAGGLLGRAVTSKEMLNPKVLREVNEKFRAKYVGKINGVDDKDVHFWNCFGMKRLNGSLDEKPLIESLD